MTVVSRAAALFATAWLLSAPLAWGEPYLAVFKGMHCSTCHSNSTGGGMRNSYGNIFSQTELAARRLGADVDKDLWSGAVTKWLSVGMDLRAGYNYVDTPNTETTSSFDVNRGAFYAEAHVIPDRLSVYIDQQFAPDASINREAFVRYTSASSRFFALAGQFYLPYGLRLQDDSAFVRQATGVTFSNPDRGIQLGYEAGPWSVQTSLTNGNGGAADTNSGKQVSLIASYVASIWRVGGSFNYNESDVGDRQMQNVFAGIRTGPIAWLFEFDLITDQLPGSGDRDAVAGLVEGNWLFLQGHNLKLSYDYLDSNRDVGDDQQVRYSLLYEYSPIQFLQARFGARMYDGVPQVDSQNRQEYFAEIHGFF